VLQPEIPIQAAILVDSATGQSDATGKIDIIGRGREDRPGPGAGSIGRDQEPGSTTRATVAHRTARNQPHSLVGPRGHGRNQGAREGPRSARGPEWGIIIGQSPVDTSKSETGYTLDSFPPIVGAPDPCADYAPLGTWQGSYPLHGPLASVRAASFHHCKVSGRRS